MRKRENVSIAGEAYARQAAQRLFQLERSMKSLRENVAGLNRHLKAPVPTGGNRYLKGSRVAPSLFERAGMNAVGNFFSNGFLSDIGLSKSGSFNPSSSQMASQWADMMQMAQRIL